MINREKFTTGPLKGYYPVLPNDKVKNRKYKSKYYTNGKNAFTAGVAKKILSGQYNKNKVLKKQKLKVQKPLKKYYEKPEILLPNFKLINPKDDIKDRKLKGKYFTNGEIWFSYDKAKQYANGDIAYNDLIANGAGGKRVEKFTNKPNSKTYRFYDIPSVILFLMYQTSSFERVFISVNALVHTDSLGTKRIWFRPFPVSFVPTTRTKLYHQRLQERIDAYDIIELDTMIFDVTLFNKGM